MIWALSAERQALPPNSETGMPRYFFDIHDGHFQRDEDGTECADFEAARREAMIVLPDIARWVIPTDGDRQTYTVIIRDEGCVRSIRRH